MRVLGIDGCRGGWVAVVLHDDGEPTASFVERLNELADVDADGIGIDIPIGLPTDGRRPADVEARAFLGARRHSVFDTPVRPALLASTHAEATAISAEVTGRGISRQSYGLRHRILETEEWLASAPAPVWEVHPEVSFALLLGHAPATSKKTWAGVRERLGALSAAGIELGDLGEAGRRVPVDDVLDAAAVAWSARRLARGAGRSFPDPPERDPATGREVAIWA